ncbi:MAG: SDR family oxidoreductase [Rhodobacter sp.]|nr:SDR family oxidoreductase [Rhodobacter sp.]MCA3492441.1 SDR family oxidoreductase [Rhodobacter sp.]MCA3498518.1 SDR family oxidoreductase [Rhodobacter sp.]MCA3505339.1 SDR family oxidoreductase [Rhodobacter sp.]MCA3515712.1 SDR family oxidoreductase [Rhodobacter sp.]
MRFTGQSVLIVGGASGLGAAAARAFAGEGADLVLVDRDGAAAERVAAGLSRARAVQGDAADPATAAAALALAAPDILFHAAGIDPASAGDVPGTSLADWQAILSVNLTSAFLFARAVLPGMIAQRRGCLLFTGSIAGIRPTPQEAAYAVSKAGVIQLARAIALDHARDGIRANALCPGFLEAVMADRRATMSAADLAERSRLASARVPMGREGGYAETAQLVLALCDDAVSGYVTGQAVVADGGVLLA